MKRYHISATLLAAAMLVGVTACGSEDGGSTKADGGGSGGMKISVESPAENSSLSAPFTVKVSSSEDLGPTSSGKHHIHLYFDDREDKYEIVENTTWKVPADSPAVQGLTPGKHMMHISLRNSDHSAAGAESEEAIMVGKGGSAPSTPPGDDDSDSGGDYGGDYGGGDY